MGRRQQLVQAAIRKLREARELLKQADARKAVSRVRSALKSAEGAERHASARDWHDSPEGRAALQRVATANC